MTCLSVRSIGWIFHVGRGPPQGAFFILSVRNPFEKHVSEVCYPSPRWGGMGRNSSEGSAKPISPQMFVRLSPQTRDFPPNLVRFRAKFPVILIPRINTDRMFASPAHSSLLIHASEIIMPSPSVSVISKSWLNTTGHCVYVIQGRWVYSQKRERWDFTRTCLPKNILEKTNLPI